MYASRVAAAWAMAGGGAALFVRPLAGVDFGPCFVGSGVCGWGQRASVSRLINSRSLTHLRSCVGCGLARRFVNETRFQIT